MAPAFSKEAILQGSIDHLCLVCESYLKTEREVCLHISTSAHRRNLDGTGYVEKYRNDRVRKVKKWYYCEFCNVLVSTISKVRLHVEEPRHKENVALQMIARLDDIVVSGNIAISEEAWHGFIDENTCTICNVEFDDKVEHKSESTHIINLIQSKLSNDFNNIYRKIDDSTFHCLTCNKVVAAITTHLDDTKHKNLIQKRIQSKSFVPEEDSEKENLVGKCAPQFINEIDVIDDKHDFPNKNATDIIEITNNNKTSVGVKADPKIDECTSETDTTNYINYDLHGKTSCSLCNCEVDPLKMKIHLDDLHHQNMLKMQKDLKKTNDNGSNINNNKHSSDILDSISKFQKENININFETCTAVCRQCSVNLEFDTKIIDDHIEEHKNKVQKKAKSVPKSFEKDVNNKERDSGTLFTSPVFRSLEKENKEKEETKSMEMMKQKDDNAIQKLVEEHNLTYTGNKLYCQKCKKQIPYSVRNINEHVNGELHRNNTKIFNKPAFFKDNENKKISAKKCTLQRVPIHQFVRIITTVKNIFAEDVVINEKYCINLLAFTFLTMTCPGRLRCQVCEVNLHLQDMKEHLDIKRHERALNEVPVVIHTDSEFIREIRSEIFQCGFCNIIDSWEGMDNHLKSTSHKENKTFANWRLSQHLPEIEQHRMERQIHNHFLMRLMFS